MPRVLPDYLIANNLLSVNLALVKEWHPTKNGSLTARDVTPNSHKKVWWRCGRGHEWEASIASRNSGVGCPYCSGQKAHNDNCLETLNPSLAREWHPTKNGNLTPKDVTSASNKRFWWVCNKGHEWEAKLNNRSHGNGCPYCAGRIVHDGNCLQTVNPELARQWHPTKNASLTPRDVQANSGKKVWWLCKKGHEWEATLDHRSKGSGCPYCAGKAAGDDNCLETVMPDLVKEWHPTKNGNLTPRDLTVGSGKKIWWKCDRGHEWAATAHNRSKGSGCPYCQSQMSQLELCIFCEMKYLFGDVHSREKISGKECDVYIPRLNVGIEVDGYYWHKDKFIKDKRKAALLRTHGIFLINLREAGLRTISDADISYSGHEKNLTVVKRIVASMSQNLNISASLRGSFNEYLERKKLANESEFKTLWDMLPSPLPGSSLFELNRVLAKEWHPTKNGSLTPKDVSLASNKKIWWMCDKGHEWETSVNNRSKDRGCPYCAGVMVCNDNCLQTLNPKLARQWHPTKNGSLTPRDVTPGSEKKIWWRCENNHEWQSIVYNRGKGVGCPYCAGKAVCNDNCLETVMPDLAKEWHSIRNGSLTARDVTSGSHKKVWWQCGKNHEWEATVKNRSKGRGCPYCTHQRVCSDNCLETVKPELARQWHPTKNGNLTARDVTSGTGKKVWWICSKGHEWEASINDRRSSNGCPYCFGQRVCNDNCLKTVNSELARQWHPTKNGNLTPSGVTAGSNKKVWWICGRGHTWEASINNRDKGRGCPYCAGKMAVLG